MANEFFEKKIRTFFNHIFDTNNNGLITFNDFELIVEKVRVANHFKDNDPKVAGLLSSLKGVFEQLLDMAGYNKDGKISFEEYLRYWKEVAMKIRNGATLEDLNLNNLVDFTFRSGDIDGDGVISENDYLTIVRSLNVFEEKDIQDAWKKVSKLGILNHQAFKKACLIFFSSENEQDPENYIYAPIV